MQLSKAFGPGDQSTRDSNQGGQADEDRHRMLGSANCIVKTYIHLCPGYHMLYTHCSPTAERHAALNQTPSTCQFKACRLSALAAVAAPANLESRPVW